MEARVKPLEATPGELALNQLEFFVSTAEGSNEQRAECPTGAKLVGGSCFAPGVGDDGEKPLFGPKFYPQNSATMIQYLTCQRYGNNRVQAIAICAKAQTRR